MPQPASKISETDIHNIQFLFKNKKKKALVQKRGNTDEFLGRGGERMTCYVVL
jgi:hypothetical protein